MKTALETANQYGCAFVEGTSSDHFIEAMKAYALQEVEKHLQIAADKCRKMDEYFDREYITGIKIDLT